jgi:hypothetical protein
MNTANDGRSQGHWWQVLRCPLLLPFQVVAPFYSLIITIFFVRGEFAAISWKVGRTRYGYRALCILEVSLLLHFYVPRP